MPSAPAPAPCPLQDDFLDAVHKVALTHSEVPPYQQQLIIAFDNLVGCWSWAWDWHTGQPRHRCLGAYWSRGGAWKAVMARRQ